MIEIPQKRSELELACKKLIEMKAPTQHVEYSTCCVGASLARCAPET